MAILTKRRNELLIEFNGNPHADVEAIEQFEAASKLHLPRDYAEFLMAMNGGEGSVGNAYLVLWRVEELVAMNQAYQSAKYAPGLLLFGTDGGGEAFAFDMRSDSMPIVSVPFVGMGLESTLPMATNFDDFLEKLSAS
jgi:cell wall assembly regulator SMI1